MAKKQQQNQLGAWAFIAGVIISIIAGFVELDPTIVSILVVLGIIVGLLNITGKEATGFLLASVVLIIAADLGTNTFKEVAVIGDTLTTILQTVVTFVVPATIVVSLRGIYNLAKN